MISDNLERECYRLKRTCAPEIPGMYLLDTADLADVLPSVRGCSGWHTPFDHNLRKWLIDRGEWCGILPVIALDIPIIRDSAADVPFTWRQVLLQVFVHELAHAVPFVNAGDVKREPSAALLEVCRNKFATFAAQPTATTVPWETHGLWFTRAALHLHHRATAAGFDLPHADGLCAGFGYAMSPAWCYQEAIGEEPARMMGATFAEIKATPAPDAFTKLFDHNRETYYHFNPPEETKCSA